MRRISDWRMPAGRGRGPALACATVLCLSGAAGAQTANPWTPPGAAPEAQYPGAAAGAQPTWAGQAPAASRYAPADLDARLSGAVRAAPVPPAPAAPGYVPGQLQAPSAVPQAVAPQVMMPQAALPYTALPGQAGVLGYAPVTPVVPGVATYPGALPYGAGIGAWPGYGAGLPYYGAGGWPGAGYGGGWPGSGWGGGWPMTGFSPFGFW
ncbi:hypothetical protein [Sinisalibacter aestuarii]|uniref:Uncharacterized protein n=1 Tax=Sinisalibacter aestuarii TaxID=2949426 RepID=A0ABQ5LR57_9RHOB|nr:hypothetical protein [Sinisalibacter aestuarii]GKY87495.1 hypothetical protein STA1M1_13640 [Sinisalibacter aestuarii]